MIVALSGPMLSLVLAIIFSYINCNLINKQDAVYSNILILLFNLLPIYPLDGGRILKYILHIKYGNKKSKQYINEISNISMFLLTFLCSIAILYFRNIAYFLICVVLWAITITENRKFKNDMKMYEIVQNQEKMEEILVLMNKWYLNRNTKKEERNKYGYVVEGCETSVEDCNRLFNTDENTRKYNGVLLSPNARSIFEIML